MMFQLVIASAAKQSGAVYPIRDCRFGSLLALKELG
jgi:hypothetical protein